jgi:hypothetical protein
MCHAYAATGVNESSLPGSSILFNQALSKGLLGNFHKNIGCFLSIAF